MAKSRAISADLANSVGERALRPGQVARRTSRLAWRRRVRRPVRLHLAAVTVFALTAAIRFLSVVGFPNDHFLYLAPAQQMRFGEWPSRDFVDPGTPMMYIASAAARTVVPPPILAEALVVAIAFGAAAALTLYAAFKASGVLWLAGLVTVAQVAFFPRSYHYPKLLMYAAAVLAMAAYVAAPSKRRAALLAGCVVVAFLFRHDHGVLLGGAAVLAAALARPGWRDAARRMAQVGMCGVLLAAPYLAYVEATTGLVPHIAAGMNYSQREADRTVIGPRRFDLAEITSHENALVWLFYAFHLLPVVALAVVVARARRERSAASRAQVAQIVPLAALAIAANVTLLRDPLDARLPDVAVTTGVLAAWLIPQAWSARPARNRPAWRPLRAVVLAVGVVTLAAVNVVGRPLEKLNRAGLWPDPTRAIPHVREHTADLRQPVPSRQLPSRVAEALVPFMAYVGRCTAPEHRLFIAGEAPEIYVFAARRFAGGQPALRGGFFDTPDDQRRLVSRLRRQQVPLALVLTDSDIDGFPIVMRQVETQFRPLAEIPVEDRPSVLVYVSRVMTPRGVDPETGFPCFQLPTPNLQLPTPNAQSPTSNLQLPISNSQRPTPNSQPPIPILQLPTLQLPISNSHGATSQENDPDQRGGSRAFPFARWALALGRTWQAAAKFCTAAQPGPLATGC